MNLSKVIVPHAIPKAEGAIIVLRRALVARYQRRSHCRKRVSEKG